MEVKNVKNQFIHSNASVHAGDESDDSFNRSPGFLSSPEYRKVLLAGRPCISRICIWSDDKAQSIVSL